MNTITRKFHFGKINLNGTGKRFPVTVTVTLYNRGGEKTFTIDPVTKERLYTGNVTPEYVEFSASALAGACMGGQCLDEINKHRADFSISDRKIWNEIYSLWKMYHLNGMHAGTPVQEIAVREYIAAGNKYDYTAACEYLKKIGLYEVPFTGKTVGRMYENEPYKYGHGWVVNDIPENDIQRIRALLKWEA